MSFKCDKETKSQMKTEMSSAVDAFMFKKFKSSIPLYKSTHQCMDKCYDKHNKAKPIWGCLTSCQRTFNGAQRSLGMIVNQFLHQPASKCLNDSMGTTQAVANEQYTKCIRDQIKSLRRARNTFDHYNSPDSTSVNIPLGTYR
eukprot:426573_1